MNTHTESSILLDDKKIEETLSFLYRAVSAHQFYPQNHPSLAEAMKDGYRAWRQGEEDFRWKQHGLEHRNGCFWLGESCIGAENPAVASLLRVFLGHGLVGLRKVGTLSQDGFSQLIAHLATSPEVLSSRGGIGSVWRRELHANAVQLQVLQVAPGGGKEKGTKRPASRREEWGSGLPDKEHGSAATDSLLLSRLQSLQRRSPREQAVVDLLLRLGHTEEIESFLDLLREITRFVESYLEVERFRESFYILLYLYREAQNMDSLGQDGKRDYLLDTIRLLLHGDFLVWLITKVTSASGEEEAETGEFILRALGKSAVVPVINALCSENSRAGRRRLVDVLVSIGDPAVPWAIKMLDDRRWFVVRNMVTVLGGVGSDEAMRALLRLSRDVDARIRREVARALGRSPSAEAETQLLLLLDDRDSAVRQMTINSCATHRSSKVLKALWKVYHRTRINKAEWEAKISVLQSIARLGLPEASKPLIAIVKRRHLRRRERWEKVTQTAIQALGSIGGTEAEQVLADLKLHRDPDIRSAASRALNLAEARNLKGQQ